ncbi:MAG: CBU_0592 family membrane protein [Maricaulaceae bacterium]
MEHTINIIGLIGVAFVLYAYFLIQTEKVTIKSLPFSLYNLIGSVLITVSLFFNFNLASFVIEVFWIAISLYGVVKVLRQR